MIVCIRKVALLASTFTLAASHMIMKTPAPFSKVPPDNSPLSSSGANFPCKNDGSVGFYDTTSRTTMAIGETQTLSFTGSAVHGGGSCQLAVTSDKAPTASTSWQVILSIEGGCPSITGDGPSTYNYEIPDGIATGDATLAWTWISKLAGQPEYYMNCAPITITGGSKKRSIDVAKRATFPDLFVANLASINDCKAGPGVDVIYPDPGSNMMFPKSASAMVNGTVSGTGCVAKGASAGAGSGSSASGGGEATPTTASVIATNPSPSSLSAAEPATTPLSSSASSPIIPPTTAPSSASSASMTFVTLSQPTLTPTTLSTAAAATPSASTPSSSSTTTGSQSSQQFSGACTPEGQWNCLSTSGGFSYQRCASGSWTGMTALSAGETCQLGLSMTLWRREAPKVANARIWRGRSYLQPPNTPA
ncbi:MAG: hypothetical protein GOMPHAMPRED_000748 [Gomphillus americanus]|uniref:Uncharacterized protein n=1 Tax=Gomphillus americanus TaxID=1940652 RepID=A0A8H3EZL4_9LECA|nr:MAG: hypothetical protein GOMPHAMPRED_000748 [Gomphillus americanus]